MARLPTPGSDAHIWGDLLNEFLLVSHNSSGQLSTNAITEDAISDNVISTSKVTNAAITPIKLDRAYVPSSEKGAALGVAALDASALLPPANLGSGAANSSTFLRGDQTWATVSKASIGLANVDNTSDASKPISTATQTAFDGKADKTTTISAGTGLSGGGDLSANRTFSVIYGATAGTVAQGNDARFTDARTPLTHAATHASGGTDPLTPAAIGLGNVNNTSDTAKPISAATQTALNAKATDAAVVHLTGSETIAGVKTFGAAPLVPTPSLDNEAANKQYVDVTNSAPELGKGYWRASVGSTSGTTTTLNAGSTECVPIMCPYGITIDAIAVRVIGVAGASVRLGLYADNGHGAPGELLVDAGTIEAAATGVKQLSVSVILPKSQCLWGAISSQGSAAVTIGASNLTPSLGVPYDSNVSALEVLTGVGYRFVDNTITGALPSVWTTKINGTSITPPRFAVRRSLV